MIRLAYYVSHPIQYQVPLLRHLSREVGIGLTAYFHDNRSIIGYHDEGFNTRVQWNVDLLSGYSYEFLSEIGKRKFNFFTNLLVKKIIRKKIDVLWLHGYSSVFSIGLILLSKIFNIKVMVRAETISSNLDNKFYKKIFRKIFYKWLKKSVDKFLAVGSLNRDFYLSIGVPPEKIGFSPYAVDNDYFQLECQKIFNNISIIKKKFSLEPGRKIILYASKLQPRKHPEDLLEAYYLLSQKISDKEMPYLLIVGDGEMRESLRQFVEKFNLRKVHFFGFINQAELPEFYVICHVFVLPSVQENWGLVVNEVMNAGKPVVVSEEVGCVPDLIRASENGFTFQARDIQALFLALLALIENDELSRKMGQKSIEIINDWGIKESAEGIINAVNQL